MRRGALAGLAGGKYALINTLINGAADAVQELGDHGRFVAGTEVIPDSERHSHVLGCDPDALAIHVAPFVVPPSPNAHVHVQRGRREQGHRLGPAATTRSGIPHRWASSSNGVVSTPRILGEPQERRPRPVMASLSDDHDGVPSGLITGMYGTCLPRLRPPPLTPDTCTCSDVQVALRLDQQMPEPTLEDLYEALTAPYTARLSPDLAAAHVLALGTDGPALRELAALSERDFDQALELLPTAYEEAAQLLAPVQAGQRVLNPGESEADQTLVIAWNSASIGDRIDELAAFLDDLSREASRLGLGEIEGPVDEAEEQVAFCYGQDMQSLQAFIAARLVDAPIPHANLEPRGSDADHV